MGITPNFLERYNLVLLENKLNVCLSGPNTNTCQFFITAKNTWWLDEKHVVFGKVLRGMWVLKQILGVETDQNDKPVRPVLISKSTVSKPDTPFTTAKVAADWMT